MSLNAWIALICLVGFVVFGALARRASGRFLYRDVDQGDVSPRSICGLLSLIFLVVLVALGVGELGC